MKTIKKIEHFDAEGTRTHGTLETTEMLPDSDPADLSSSANAGVPLVEEPIKPKPTVHTVWDADHLDVRVISPNYMMTNTQWNVDGQTLRKMAEAFTLAADQIDELGGISPDLEPF